jgi:hypothetical protein
MEKYMMIPNKERVKANYSAIFPIHVVIIVTFAFHAFNGFFISRAVNKILTAECVGSYLSFHYQDNC